MCIVFADLIQVNKNIRTEKITNYASKVCYIFLSQAARAWGFLRPGVAKLKATTNSFSVHTPFIENDTFGTFGRTQLKLI